MGIECAFVLAQVIPAHRPDVQIGGAVIFVLVLFGVLALFRRVSRRADLQLADEVIEEHWAQLESAQLESARLDSAQLESAQRLVEGEVPVDRRSVEEPLDRPLVLGEEKDELEDPAEGADRTTRLGGAGDVRDRAEAAQG